MINASRFPRIVTLGSPEKRDPARERTDRSPSSEEGSSENHPHQGPSEWTPEIELEFKRIYNESVANRHLSLKASNYFKRRATVIKILLTLISGLITLLAAMAKSDQDLADNQVVQFMQLALGTLLTIISSINSIFAFDKRTEQFRKYAGEWGQIRDKAHHMFRFDDGRRKNAKHVFEDMCERKLELGNDAAYPKKVVAEYMRMLAPHLEGGQTNMMPGEVNPTHEFIRFTPKQKASLRNRIAAPFKTPKVGFQTDLPMASQ